MIHNFVSSQTVLRMVHRTLRPTSNAWGPDAVEWIGEALGLIGSIPQLVDKVKDLEVKNYRANLPCDLEVITMMGYSGDVTKTVSETGGMIPLQYATDAFPVADHCDDCVNMNAKAKETYYLAGNMAKFSFEEGYACISYKGYPVDDDGFPMIPNEQSFAQALFWFVASRLLLAGYDVKNKSLRFQDAEQRWLEYCTQARNDANMPDIAEYENFLNQWVRLIPDMNHFDRMFNSQNEREELDRDFLRYAGGGVPASGVFNRDSAKRI